jgi:branched-chain amino acid transport system permease protein
LELVLTSLLNGVTYGLLLFMLSSGLTLIFSMMGVLNFAHASFYMLGAYFGYAISTKVGFYPALVLSPLAVGAIGALVERYGLRRAHSSGHVSELLFTFGLAFVIAEAVRLIWGSTPVPYKVPQSLDGPLFTLYHSTFPAYKAFMMLVSVSMLAALYMGLAKTRVGLVIRAALTRPDMAEALGHDVPRVFMLVFGGGAALAALAGVIGGNAFVTDPGMAESLGTIVFVVVVVGGLGSLTGAFAASLFIGIIQTFAVAVDYSFRDFAGLVGIDPSAYPALARVTVSQVAPVLPYLIMVAMLIARPRGLMGTRET